MDKYGKKLRCHNIYTKYRVFIKYLNNLYSGCYMFFLRLLYLS